MTKKDFCLIEDAIIEAIGKVCSNDQLLDLLERHERRPFVVKVLVTDMQDTISQSFAKRLKYTSDNFDTSKFRENIMRDTEIHQIIYKAQQAFEKRLEVDREKESRRSSKPIA